MEPVYFFWEFLLFVGGVEDKVLKHIRPYDLGCDLGGEPMKNK
jgi:hypothetical protein